MLSMVHGPRTGAGTSGTATTSTGRAISAVDTALWDLKARLLQQPLGRLFGAAVDEIPVYGSGGFTTYDDARMSEQPTGWVHGQRIGRVKIKIGEDWGTDERRDLRRVGRAREIIGAEADLYVDANGAYDRKQAVRMADAMADFDVRWFEEPVSSCGGYSEWLRAAAVAAAYGIEVSGHCAPNLHAPVAAATPNLRHLEWFHDHVRIESELFDGALDPSGGVLTLPMDHRGNGLGFRPDAAERYRVA